MAKINGLEKHTYAELLELRQRVDAALLDRKSSEERELKQKLEALAAESGFSMSDLFGGKKVGKKGSVGAAKFRNPKDSSQTWTGRGRKPNWLVDALKKGVKLESLAI